MNPRRFLNTLFFIVAGYALYLKAPNIMNNFKFQDKVATNFTVKTLSGENFILHSQTRKVILVFWATWCGPCEVELKRINKMVMDKKIQPADVLAISSNEEEAKILETKKKENYLFNIAIDPDGTVARLFQVSATPTVIFIDEAHTINWMTAGISPTLEFRISSFLK